MGRTDTGNRAGGWEAYAGAAGWLAAGGAWTAG